MRYLLLSLLVVISAFSAHAQGPVLNGAFVLAEEGFSPNGPISTLATLQLAENGSVTGALLLHTDFDLLHADVQGFYKMETATAGSLTLSTTATDAEGNSITKEYKYRLVKNAASEFTAVRSDSGYFATAKIYPAARAALAGSFVFSEIGADHKYSRIGLFNLEAGGTISGFEYVESLGVEALKDVKGSYLTDENGFGKLMLKGERVAEDGETVSVTETFYFLATQNEMKLVRHEGQVRMLSMTR